jgi:hypothetical protein
VEVTLGNLDLLRAQPNSPIYLGFTADPAAPVALAAVAAAQADADADLDQGDLPYLPHQTVHQTVAGIFCCCNTTGSVFTERSLPMMHYCLRIVSYHHPGLHLHLHSTRERASPAERKAISCAGDRRLAALTHGINRYLTKPILVAMAHQRRPAQKCFRTHPRSQRDAQRLGIAWIPPAQQPASAIGLLAVTGEAEGNRWSVSLCATHHNGVARS